MMTSPKSTNNINSNRERVLLAIHSEDRILTIKTITEIGYYSSVLYRRVVCLKDLVAADLEMGIGLDIFHGVYNRGEGVFLRVYSWRMEFRLVRYFKV